MDLANHCASFPGLSLLNTRTVTKYVQKDEVTIYVAVKACSTHGSGKPYCEKTRRKGAIRKSKT
jgi:hypothetical protein